MKNQVHLEDRMLAWLLNDSHLPDDSWRLGGILSTWLHRDLVTPTDERLRNLTGWSAERLAKAQEVLAKESNCWTLEPAPGRGYQYHFTSPGFDASERPTSWGDDFRTSLPYRTAMKHALIFPDPQLSIPAMRVLAALGAHLSHRTCHPVLIESIADSVRRLSGVQVLRQALVELHAEGIILMEKDPWTVRFTPTTRMLLAKYEPLFFEKDEHGNPSMQQRNAWEQAYTARVAELSGQPCITELTGKVSVIYGLIDPRDGALRYIGKTNRPHLRFHEHASALRNNHSGNEAYSQWVNELNNTIDPETGQAMAPQFTILRTFEQGVSEHFVLRMEALAIHEAVRDGHSLLNKQHVTMCPTALTRLCVVEHVDEFAAA